MSGKQTAEYIKRQRLGELNLNDAQEVAGVNGQWVLPPDLPLTDRQDFDAFNVWYEDGANSTVSRAGELYELRTDATVSDAESTLESAPLGVYRPGTTVTASGGVWVDSFGDGGYVDVAYTQRETTDRLGWRLRENDLQYVIETGGSADQVVLSRQAGDFEHGAVRDQGMGQSVGLNPMDGTVYGATWRPTHGHVYGTKLGWYGPSGVIGYITALGNVNGEWAYWPWPVFMLDPQGDPAFEIPNQPLQVAAANDGTAAEVQARVGGRQFMYRGEFQTSPKAETAWATDQSIAMDGSGAGDTDWYVLGVVRRKNVGEGIAVGLDTVEIEAGQGPVAITTSVVDAQYLNGTLEYRSPRGVAQTQATTQFDLQADTPDRITLDSYTDSDGLSKPQGVVFGGNTIPQGTNKKDAQERLDEFGVPLVRDNPTVLLGTARDGSSVDVNTAITLKATG